MSVNILAGLGAAVFPWFVGLASSHYGGLRAGLVAPLAGGCVMLGCVAKVSTESGSDRVLMP